MELKSKYFTLKELTVNKNNLPNIPNQEQFNNLQLLVTNVLDPLREMYGKPITINSGFRNKKVNDLAGGVDTSEHMRGMAADIDTNNDNPELYQLIKKNFKFRQLIDEKNFS